MKLKEIIYESLLLFEDERHVRQLFTSWAKKKSGNPELAMSLIDDFFRYKKNIKRDFTSFSSAEEMAQSIEKAKSSEQEKIKATDADKIYEDDKILVVAAKTHEASCKYAAGTKWCTGAADTDQYWKRHNRTGTEFIWVIKGLNKDNSDYKISLHFKWTKNIKMTQSPSQKFDSDWCNAQNRCSSRIPNTLLTILGEDSFDNIFNKCMGYHEKRSLDRPTDTDLKNKFITKAREVYNELDGGKNEFDYALNDLDFHYLFQERLVDDYDINIDDFGDDQIGVVYHKFFNSALSKFNDIKENVFTIFEDNVLNYDEDELEDDFQYLQVEHPEYTGDYILNIMVNMYLKSHLGELYYEELNLFMDEFIDKWLSENYGV
jgi:hypothetical protein